MVAKRKKKFESGEGARYFTRNKALKYLQLSLNDFRRLCILKGVYPREPKNRKKAQKGATGIQILYHKKDIQFLLHEPNVWKLREFKTLFRRIRTAKALRQSNEVDRLCNSFPVLNLDHIVKERYPTFIDAIRDLDDCLTLLFLFASFPHLKRVPEKIIKLCCRLTVEFMHYVIAAKALRKVFISIKGFYYQAEIKGELVTWIVPHQFVTPVNQSIDIDFKIMMDFVNFYIVMLGFVNFRLYHSLNITYPPIFPGFTNCLSAKDLTEEESYAADRIAALNVDLSKCNGGTTAEEMEEIDEFPMINDQEKIEEIKREYERKNNLKTLFKGLKFFINREVPREPLVFVIKCLSGDVSWESTCFIGATFDESDESITHQIVDRPMVNKQYISRYYVQPQWVFDSVNACKLLPVEKYFLGVVLPPHLSPFHSEHKLDRYIPPEEAALTDAEVAKQLEESSNTILEENSEESDVEDVTEDEDEKEEDTSKEMSEDLESEEEDEIDKEEKERRKRTRKMNVKPDEIVKEDPFAQKKLDREEYRLRVSMIKNKHRKLYHSMISGRSKRDKEAWLLRKKRKIHDEGLKEELKKKVKEKKRSFKNEIVST